MEKKLDSNRMERNNIMRNSVPYEGTNMLQRDMDKGVIPSHLTENEHLTTLN
jgi:hypothetical protein